MKKNCLIAIISIAALVDIPSFVLAEEVPVSITGSSGEALGEVISLTLEEIEAQTKNVEPEFRAFTFETNNFSSQSNHASAQATNGFSIDNSDRNSVVSGFHQYYVASENYANNHNWNGNVGACDEGTVSSDFQDDVLRRVNYYRAQVGLPADIYFDATKNAKSQDAALIFSRNNILTHFPSNSLSCWTQDGYDAAFAGNISFGTYGPYSIDRLMLDTGSNNAAVGHRRWMLYPEAQEMGNGSIPPNGSYSSANSLWVIGDFKANQPAVAVGWPNEGYIPYLLVPNDSATHPRWSFSYPGANFTNATVTMSQGGQSIHLTQEVVTPAFGSNNFIGDNTIVWLPSGIPSTAPSSDTTYTVTISGVANALQIVYTYDVIVIDPYRLNEAATITGSSAPSVNQSNTYAFTPVSGAEAYALYTAETLTGNWLEGAEDSPSPQVTDNTSGAYNLTTTALSATGSKSFHLTIPSFSESEQIFEIDRDIIPSASSQLVFKNRFRFVTTDSYLSLDISTDNGSSWTSLWIRNGDANSSSGNSSTWETTWQNVSLPISSEYADQIVRIRFRFDSAGSVFLGTGTNIGCFVDDIEVTQSQEAINASTSTLSAGASSFDFTPTNETQYALAIAAHLGGHQFSNGPTFFATAVQPIPAPLNLDSDHADHEVPTGNTTHTFTWDPPATGATIVGYSYALNQTPDDSVDSTTTTVTYSNLAPGTHTFHVKAIMDNGASSEVATFTLIIDPSLVIPTMTEWGILILVALILLLAMRKLQENQLT